MDIDINLMKFYLINNSKIIQFVMILVKIFIALINISQIIMESIICSILSSFNADLNILMSILLIIKSYIYKLFSIINIIRNLVYRISISVSSISSWRLWNFIRYNILFIFHSFRWFFSWFLFFQRILTFWYLRRLHNIILF
jgi:hypothetical protein